MDDKEYRAFIERMRAEGNIINHLSRILDLLIPAGVKGGIELLYGPAAFALLRVDGGRSKVFCEEVA